MRYKSLVWFSIMFMAAGQYAAGQGSNEAVSTTEDVNDPNVMLKITCDEVISVLGDKGLDLKAKEAKLDEIISPFFDFELMSKLSLGKANWTRLSETQQCKFVDLFTKRLKKTYLEQITLYNNEQLVLKPAQQRKTGVSISMDVVSGEKKIAVLYKLRQATEQWKVYDVEIEGVSILRTYKAQFEDVLKKGSVEDLFAQL